MFKRVLDIGYLAPLLLHFHRTSALRIAYNGTLSGSFIYNNGVSRNLGNFSNLVNTSLWIGVNPPWDENPLFFELQHSGNDYRNNPRRSILICHSFFGSYCTTDAIYNLQFASAYYDCVQDAFICGGSYHKEPYYARLPIVNLKAAEIINTTGQMPGSTHSVPLYIVRGDEKTYVGNGTIEKYGGRNQFNIQDVNLTILEYEFYW